MTKSLAGRKPLVTRSAEDADEWCARLKQAGAEPIVLPCIRTEQIADPTLGMRLDAAVAHADWLVFTSRRGVDSAAALTSGLPGDIRIAAVSEATAARARECFGSSLRPDPVALIGKGTAAALARELASDGILQAGGLAVLALAANASATLQQTLKQAGGRVERFDVYRTIPAAQQGPKQSLAALGCDLVLFASPTAVVGFANQVNVDLGVQIVTIGPSTSAAVREHGWQVTAEAKEPSLSGMIEALETTDV